MAAVRLLAVAGWRSRWHLRAHPTWVAAPARRAWVWELAPARAWVRQARRSSRERACRAPARATAASWRCWSLRREAEARLRLATAPCRSPPEATRLRHLPEPACSRPESVAAAAPAIFAVLKARWAAATALQRALWRRPERSRGARQGVAGFSGTRSRRLRAWRVCHRTRHRTSRTLQGFQRRCLARQRLRQGHHGH